MIPPLPASCGTKHPVSLFTVIYLNNFFFATLQQWVQRIPTNMLLVRLSTVCVLFGVIYRNATVLAGRLAGWLAGLMSMPLQLHFRATMKQCQPAARLNGSDNVFELASGLYLFYDFSSDFIVFGQFCVFLLLQFNEVFVRFIAKSCSFAARRT